MTYFIGKIDSGMTHSPAPGKIRQGIQGPLVLAAGNQTIYKVTVTAAIERFQSQYFQLVPPSIIAKMRIRNARFQEILSSFLSPQAYTS